MTPAQVLADIAEAKSYTLSCFTNTVSDARQAVIFHYMRGKITYVYHGAPSCPLTDFILFRDLNILDLKERVKTDLGINLTGGIHSRTGVPADYGVPADQWRPAGMSRQV
jgi:hypothetical protein